MCAFAQAAIAGDALKLHSGKEGATLIELFTSQGCSSCPPAEQWLNQYVENGDLWTRYVPVAWHVDYWDGLGWPDPFASKANTARQYQYKQEQKIGSVYTPCFVVNGAEWRGWFNWGKLPDERLSGGALEAVIEGRVLTARYERTDQARDQPLELHAAILGCGLATDVKRGENSGRRLQQDFTQLAYRAESSKTGEWKFELPRPAESATERLGIALWVTPEGSLNPLQAAGGWLPGNAADE